MADFDATEGCKGVTSALVKVKAATETICNDCGTTLVCRFCYTADVVMAARQAVAEVVRGVGGRNSTARVSAAKLILARDYLDHLTDEDLLAAIHKRKTR